MTSGMLLLSWVATAVVFNILDSVHGLALNQNRDVWSCQIEYLSKNSLLTLDLNWCVLIYSITF